jgi:hypothetical protein
MLAATRYGVFSIVYSKCKQYLPEQNLVLSNILSPQFKFLFSQRKIWFSTEPYHLFFWQVLNLSWAGLIMLMI